jgi:hypothetical protein
MQYRTSIEVVFRHIWRSTCLAVAVVMLGCSSSADIPVKKSTKPLQEHEKSFDPTVYRNDKNVDKEKEITKPAPSKPKAETWIERTEKVMGYRIQLYSTTHVDEAQRQLQNYLMRLDSLSLESARLDLTFDAPYYKIRLGDFLAKPPADSLRSILNDQGITEAWVVRDQVLRIVREMK